MLNIDWRITTPDQKLCWLEESSNDPADDDVDDQCVQIGFQILKAKRWNDIGLSHDLNNTDVVDQSRILNQIKQDVG